MTSSKQPPLSNHPFWIAVSSGDLQAVRTLLEADAALVNRDFRPPEEQDPHTFGFPLVKAADSGNLEMVKLLLEYGADIDAKSPHEDQRELGAPIMHAFEGGHYDIVRYLLEQGASLDAHGYCYPALIELLYEAACKAGAPKELVRRGFAGYLGAAEATPVGSDSPEVVQLFVRALELGGQPSMDSIVRQEYYELIQELLSHCPDAPGTQHDHPPGTVFETLCRAASWWGYPRVLELAKQICPIHYTREMALNAIRRAVVSHNRDGLASDYYQLIKSELDFLKDQGVLDEVIETGSLLSHYVLAKDYLWPGWYGNPQEPSSLEAMIQLSELFIAYGFTDLNRRDPESGETAIACARARADHSGLAEFADYLETRRRELTE